MTPTFRIEVTSGCDSTKTSSKVVVINVINGNCVGPKIDRGSRENTTREVMFKVWVVFPKLFQRLTIVLVEFRGERGK